MKEDIKLSFTWGLRIFVVGILAMLALGCKEQLRTAVGVGTVVYGVGYEVNRTKYCEMSEEEQAAYRAQEGISEGHYACE